MSFVSQHGKCTCWESRSTRSKGALHFLPDTPFYPEKQETARQAPGTHNPFRVVEIKVVKPEVTGDEAEDMWWSG